MAITAPTTANTNVIPAMVLVDPLFFFPESDDDEDEESELSEEEDPDPLLDLEELDLEDCSFLGAEHL